MQITPRMSRYVGELLACVAFVASLGASAVQAHSAPGVTAILDEDAAGLHLLRLYYGMVIREGSDWRFICSQIYGGIGQDLAASLPGGGAVIGTPTGIIIMKRDGTVAPHPDPEAQRGVVTAFARSAGKLYALRMRPDGAANDLIEITESTVRVLWTDARYWNDIAIGPSSISLVRISQDTIEAVGLSFDGQVLSDQVAVVVDPLEATVRVIANVPYYTVRTSRSTSLGRFDQNAWHVVLDTGNSIAGPLALPDGTVLVALEGQLATLANDMATPLAETDFVIGLNQLEDHPYACTRTGLRDLSSSALGASRFELSELLAPDLCLAPEAMRDACELEWQHFQIELLGANIPVATDTEPAKQCAGPVAGSAGSMLSAADQAGSSSNGLAGASPQMSAGEAASPPSGQAGASEPTTQVSSGCSCCILRRSEHGAEVACALLFALTLFVRTRRRLKT